MKSSKIKDLLDVTFIIISDRGRFSQFVGKECKVEISKKKYKITTVNKSDKSYYISDPDWYILCYRSDINPEYIL